MSVGLLFILSFFISDKKGFTIQNKRKKEEKNESVTMTTIIIITATTITIATTKWKSNISNYYVKKNKSNKQQLYKQ